MLFFDFPVKPAVILTDNLDVRLETGFQYAGKVASFAGESRRLLWIRKFVA